MGIFDSASSLSMRLFVSLPPGARRSLMKAVNAIPEFRGSLLNISLPEAFERQAGKFAQCVAVKDSTGSVSYAELNGDANRLARSILAQLGEGEEAVALLVQQGRWAAGSLLGVMKAGKFCVPMDTTHPVSRLATIMQDSGARLIVTDVENADLAAEVAGDGATVLNAEELDTALSRENLGTYPPTDSIAFVLYTSGSTGQPKGVIQTHRNVLYQTARRSYRALSGPRDRVCLLTAQGYIGSSALIFSTFMSGAAFLPYDVRRLGVSGLAQWLEDEGVTIYYSVPTLFRALLENTPEGVRFPRIRIVSLSGEQIRKSDLDLFHSHFSRNCLLLIGYGCTECSTVTWKFIGQGTRVDGHMVSVGPPFWSCDVYILDDHGNPLPKGEVGEIAASSPTLTEGYWRRPDITAERFKLSPKGKRMYLTGDLGKFLPDGELVHLGRKDRQVKVRGHRIEPAEIEMAIVEHPGISAAVVVGKKDRAGEMQLAGYVVPRVTARVPFRELNAFLRTRLPEHMVPSVLVRMIALPTLPNGKVDLANLPEPDWERNEQRATYVAPRTPVEEQVAAVWSEILGTEHIGIYDDFAELGGNSLLAISVASRLSDSFKVELPLASVLGNPTVEGMARSVSERLAEDAGAERLELLLGELEQISDEEARTRTQGSHR